MGWNSIAGDDWCWSWKSRNDCAEWGETADREEIGRCDGVEVVFGAMREWSTSCSCLVDIVGTNERAGSVIGSTPMGNDGSSDTGLEAASVAKLKPVSG